MFYELEYYSRLQIQFLPFKTDLQCYAYEII